MLMEDKPPVGGPSVPVGAHKVGGASDQGVRDVRRQINGREEMGGVAGIGAYNVGRLQDQTFGDRRNGQPMGGREEMGGVAGIGAYNVGRFQNQTFGGRRNGQPMDEREEGEDYKDLVGIKGVELQVDATQEKLLVLDQETLKKIMRNL